MIIVRILVNNILLGDISDCVLNFLEYASLRPSIDLEELEDNIETSFDHEAV
jgi:hypothetical protein